MDSAVAFPTYEQQPDVQREGEGESHPAGQLARGRRQEARPLVVVGDTEGDVARPHLRHEHVAHAHLGLVVAYAPWK